MILRRFMVHVKEQNWFAVVLDVVVVIVGIFLGMQVQQLYEERQNRNYERVILSEISNSLENDLSNIEKNFIPRIETKEMALSQLHEWIHKGYQPTDKELAHQVGLMSVDFLARYDSGSYESLKTRGFQMISQEPLRNDLIRYYEDFITSQHAFIENRKNHLRPLIDELHSKLTLYVSVKDELTGKYYISLRPNNPDMLNNQNFLKLMSYQEAKANTQRLRIEAILTKTFALKQRIDNYLLERL